MSAPRQLELPAAPAPARKDLAPLFTIKPDHPNVTWLIELLKRNGWMTRRMVIEAAARPVNDHNVRWVRSLVQAAGPVIVKGQAGFNHSDNCTLDEITHAANQSEAQGKLMIEYSIALRRRVHQRVA